MLLDSAVDPPRAINFMPFVSMDYPIAWLKDAGFGFPEGHELPVTRVGGMANSRPL
jgi:hypothetical protein